MPRANAVIAWLLLLPAVALLAAFTHYPALATLWHSLHSTPKPGREARFVGLDQYRALLDDPVFWTSLVNNAWYAAGTIVPSIALAMAMALLVHGRLRGRALARLAFFTPTILPMIAVANIWLFFYTPAIRLAGPDPAASGVARRTTGWARARRRWAR